VHDESSAFAVFKFLVLLGIVLLLHDMKSVYNIGNCDELNASQAVLLIEAGETHCCFAIVDYANFMIVQAACYTAAKQDEDLLKTMIDTHAELRQAFRQTVVSYYATEDLLIPSKLYHYEAIQSLLGSLYEKDQNTIVSESVSEWQLYNVYYIPSARHGLLSRKFATGNFWHVYSIFLKNRIEQNDGGDFLIDFKTESFSVIGIRDHVLQVAGIFSYSRATDVLYWLLKISREFSFSQNEVHLVLSGLIDRQSSVFQELYQYFVHIKFASIENDLQLSRDFADYPIHFFSSLYKLAICVS